MNKSDIKKEFNYMNGCLIRRYINKITGTQKDFYAYKTKDGWRAKVIVYTKKCNTEEEAIKEAYRIIYEQVG